jgi:hypothetical protein
MYRFFNVAITVLIATGLALAQNATGTIDGRVTDSTGGIMPGTKVTIENPATNVRWTLVTNSEGRFYQR